MEEEKQLLINPNPTLQSYYNSLESRIGYRIFLGGTRHFGYYDEGAWWPFSINRALRRMEDHLFQCLNLPSGARILDAGCGVGHVAMYMARQGLRVEAIDVVQHHVVKARRNVQADGLQKAVNVNLMDYHHLENFADASFDGVYTMETLVHATDPERVLSQFYRLMKPGGHIAMHEYDHIPEDRIPQEGINPRRVKSTERVNRLAAMPGNQKFEYGVLKTMLENQGFEDVVLKDITDHLTPLIMLFFVVAYVPWMLIQFLGLEHRFVNTEAGVWGYWAHKRRYSRYVVLTAKKPAGTVAGENDLRQRRAV